MDGPIALHGRAQEVSAATDALTRLSGCSLVGPAGVGKSRLAGELADWAERQGWYVVRVRTTASTAELPLGAFLPQLGPDERFLTPMFSELRLRIGEASGGRQVLITVDDVDQLDDVSMVLLQQLVAYRATRLVTTMRTGRMAPAELIDLWVRGEVTRIELAPLDAQGTAALGSALVGRTLTPGAADLLHAATEGNALFVRELLAAADERGLIQVDDRGLAHLAGLPSDASRVVEMVSSRLAHLDPAARSALEHLAFAEPCGWAEVASVADLDLLTDLEEQGLVAVEPDRRRLSLRLAHPLYGEVLRTSTSHLARRSILATLAGDLYATGVRRRSDQLRLARMAVDGGVSVEPDLLVRAASTAFHAGDLMLAERIGRAAFAASDSFHAGWDLAQALYQMGDVGSTREHLAQWAERAAVPSQHLGVAMTAAQLEFWYVGDLAAAERITREAIATHGAGTDDAGGGATADELTANLALFVAISGEPARALALAEPMLSDEPGPVMVRSALAAANALGAQGRAGRAVAVLDRAVAAFATIGDEGVSLSERIFVSARAVGRAWAGDLDGAAADAAIVRAQATNEFERAAAQLTTALVPILRGRPAEAVAHIERALDWWGRAAPGSTERRWALARLAWARAAAGDVAGATETLGAIEADHSPGVLFDYEAAMARAIVMAVDGRVPEARAGLRAAMATERGRGHVMGEAFCAYGLVRMETAAAAVAKVAARLSELSAVSDSRLVAAMAAHAAAVATDDAPALGEVAETLAAMGFMRLAVEASARAAEVLRRGGEQRASIHWANRSREWLEACDAHGLPTPRVGEAAVPLTRREREIGLLAAEGLANKEIAERLFISARTAENHLAKVFDKLGVRSRSELAAVFSAL